MHLSQQTHRFASTVQVATVIDFSHSKVTDFILVLRNYKT